MRATLSIENKIMQGSGQAFPASIPASIKGWDAISSLADMPPDHAVQLDNWIPRPGYLEIRRGSDLFASGCGTSTTSVETIMAYNSPDIGTSKLFAVGGGTIYDITAGATAAATSITGLANSRLQYVNFTNAADTSFLVACNGANTPIIYDGSTWSNMTLSGFTVADAIQPQAWKGRLWFTIANSTQVAYLPVGAIAGTAATFDLGPFMSLGGYINAVATWTVDTKQTVDEYLAFISSRGQVFVYQGTDPATANTFALVGVYNLGAPIGRRCFLRISGNLWIITQDGVIPMTEMLAIDRSDAPRIALTSMIMNAINSSVQQYSSNFGWQFISYPRGTLAILNIPTSENVSTVQYVMNTITGAWCRFTGINCNCWEIFNDRLFFGSNDSNVYEWDMGSGDEVGDENFPITATVQTAFNYFNTRGYLKRFTAIRPIITTDNSITPGVGLNIDFGSGAPISVPSTITTTGAQWDVAIWDQSTWPINSATVANWTTVEGIGQCASVITQVVTADNGLANGVLLQLNSWDITMEKGVGFFEMKRLMAGHDDEVACWTFDTFRMQPHAYDMALGIIDENDNLIGSVMWHAYRGSDIEISYYGPRTVTLGIARACAKMALDFWKVSRVTARTSRRNKMMTRGIKKIGFEYEGICHHGYGDEDAIMYGLYGRNLHRLAGRTLQ